MSRFRKLDNEKCLDNFRLPSRFLLEVALERFYTGETQKHSTLAHFGETPVTANLAARFW